MRIYKYEFVITGKQVVRMHGQSPKVVLVGLDARRRPCIWAEVDESAALFDHEVYVFGTGNFLDPYLAGVARHIGSFIEDPFVWHVYSGTLARGGVPHEHKEPPDAVV